MDPDLQRLLDERAIERLLVDYCRGVDRLDAALVASVYHSDGTDDHGSFKGLGVDSRTTSATAGRAIRGDHAQHQQRHDPRSPTRTAHVSRATSVPAIAGATTRDQR